jgi:predicted Rdx family selenoprotein
MKYLTMTSIRNQQLRYAVGQEMEQSRKAGKPIEVAEAVHRVVHRPTTGGYYVGVDHVVQMWRKWRKGRMPHMEPLRRQMWDELLHKVVERQRATGCNNLSAICHVLASATASRFFITDSTALKLV